MTGTQDSSADPKEVDGRITRSRARVGALLKTVLERPAGSTRVAPIRAVLEPYADEIKDLLRRGYTAGQIAAALDDGVEFDRDSIRQRIWRDFVRGQNVRTPNSAQAIAPKCNKVAMQPRKRLVSPVVAQQNPSVLHTGSTASDAWEEPEA